MKPISVKAARVAMDWTQQELAEKMGVSRQTVNYWETGKRSMRTPNFYLFCRLTGFSEDDIILPKKFTESKNP